MAGKTILPAACAALRELVKLVVVIELGRAQGTMRPIERVLALGTIGLIERVCREA